MKKIIVLLSLFTAQLVYSAGISIITSSPETRKIYSVKDFGALGNGVQLTNVYLTNATTTLICTSAVFTASDVGKSVLITGAGGAGADLSTTISAFVDSTNVTLANAASTTVQAYPGRYGSDDATAIQAGLNYVSTNGGGTLYFPKGIYIVKGSFDATKNSILTLPDIPWADTGTVIPNLIIEGEMAPWSGFTGPGSSPQWGSSGTWIMCNVVGTGTTAALLNAENATTPYINSFNQIRVTVRNIGFRLASNPQMTCLDLGYASTADLWNTYVDTGWIGYQGPAPTLATSTGIVMPRTNNSGGGINRLDQVSVTGFYLGVVGAEHVFGCQFSAIACVTGIRLDTTYHASDWYDINLQGCQTNIAIGGAHRASFYMVDIEHAASSGNWWNTRADLYDAGNLGSGYLWWSVTKAGTGIDHTWTQIGGNNIVVNEMAGTFTAPGTITGGSFNLNSVKSLNFYVATPSLGAQKTNIVIDFSTPILELNTTTNMNLSSYANLPSGYWTNNAVCKLKILANGGDVIVNSGLTVKIANGSASFPLTVTNGDWGIFSFDAWGNNVTNVAVAYAWCH